jgi:hypothetical protein
MNNGFGPPTPFVLCKALNPRPRGFLHGCGPQGDRTAAGQPWGKRLVLCLQTQPYIAGEPMSEIGADRHVSNDRDCHVRPCHLLGLAAHITHPLIFIHASRPS